MREKIKILVINGPNLSMLGAREPDIYGPETQEDIFNRLKELAEKETVEINCVQSNSEGALVDIVNEALGKVSAIIINAGAYTHTSIAIRDALAMHRVPVVEVHLSNIYGRESFRHHSYISEIAQGQITGFGTHSYELAFYAAIHMITRVPETLKGPE